MQEIETDGRIFRLKAPLEVQASVEDGVWVNRSPSLGIHAFGEDRGSSLHSFCEDFAVLYDKIASSPDESLTQDALRVKQAFHEIVESVRPSP